MKKILIVTRSRSLVNDLASRRRFSSRFFLMPAHDLEAARATLAVTKVHLVVIEMGLANLGGFKLLAALHSGASSPPVIAVREIVAPPDTQAPELAGFFRVVHQPVNYEELLELIHERLDDFAGEGIRQPVTPAAILRLIELERQTLICECRLEESGAQWQLHFHEGRLADARRDGVQDLTALAQVAALERVTIQIQPAPPPPRPAAAPSAPMDPTSHPAAEPPAGANPSPVAVLESLPPPPAPTATPPESGQPREAVLRRLLDVVGEIRSLEGALLVTEAGEVKESVGALEERTRREVGLAIRQAFSGAALVVGHLFPENFQGLTLEADGHVISCWKMGRLLLALLVTDPRDLGLIRLRMPLLLPKLRELIDG